MDTSGFYTYSQTEQMMMCGPNFVLGPYERFSLYRDKKDTYTYPVEGWYWFDSDEEAYKFFEIEWTPETETFGLVKN